MRLSRYGTIRQSIVSRCVRRSRSMADELGRPPRIIATSKGAQVSYPGLTQTTDGTIVAVWQAQREDGGRDIRYARFTREWVLGGWRSELLGLQSRRRSITCHSRWKPASIGPNCR